MKSRQNAISIAELVAEENGEDVEVWDEDDIEDYLYENYEDVAEYDFDEEVDD